MSTRQYQSSRKNYQEQDSAYLDDLYSRLNRSDETQIDLAQNLSNSVKALSKKWLQEAYLDGMMLADQLHKITSQNKIKPSLSEPQNRVEENISSGDNAQLIAEIVRQEIQKLGLSSQGNPQVSSQSVPQLTSDIDSKNTSAESRNGFGDFLFGSLLMLSGFFIIGGAIGYYGLDTQISSYISSGYASITGNKATQTNSSTLASNSVSTTQNTNQKTPSVAIKPVAPAQLASTQSQPPTSSNGPALNLPSDNTNSTNPNQQNANTTTTASSQATPQNLPASCNGQLPQANRPLNIQNPSDRAVLYCILDIQAQKQNTSNSYSTQPVLPAQQDNQSNPQPVPQDQNQMQNQTQQQSMQQNLPNYPDPNSIPQR